MPEIDQQQAVELIEFGSEVAGSAVGGALGFFAGGPVGAAAGSVAGTLASKSLHIAIDFAHRRLSRREKVRVGAGLAFALETIGHYLEEGRLPRSDGFFEHDVTGRSASDEILEGVLQKCKNEHEEKKLKHLGITYANVAFLPEISVFGANWLLQVAQELTYRQLCILAIVGQKGVKGASWGPRDGDPAFEMEYKRLEDYFARDNSRDAIKLFNETGEGRSIVGLSRIGQFCYTGMSLEQIAEEDLQRLRRHFPRAFSD